MCEGIQATEGILSTRHVDVIEAHGEAEALPGSLSLSLSLTHTLTHTWMVGSVLCYSQNLSYDF
jgi:hypothetical protein